MAINEPAFGSEIVEEGGGRFEVFILPNGEDAALKILNDCFLEWEHIHIGTLIPGALWEARPPCKPRITVHDGYATVDFPNWHIHICIREQRGADEADQQC